MGFLSSIASFFEVPQAYEAKGYINAPAPRSADQISALVEADFGGFGSEENFKNSVVYACARVIAEGLALPEAARKLWWLAEAARRLDATGVALKDGSDALLIEREDEAADARIDNRPDEP